MSLIFYQYDSDIDNLEVVADKIKQVYKRADKEIQEESEEYELLEEFVAQSEELLGQQDYNQIITKVFQLRNKFDDVKINSSLVGICAYYVQYLEDQKKRSEAYNNFIKHVKELENASINQQIGYLGMLFNSLQKYPQEQYKLLIELIEYSSQNGHLAMLKQSFANIDTLTQQWNLKNAEKRYLYKLIISKINNNLLMEEMKYDLMRSFIGCYEASEINETEIKQITEYIVALLSQDNITFVEPSLLETEAYKYLQQQKKTIAEALKFFIQGNLAGYLDFQKSQPEAIKALGLNEEQYSRFIRIKAIPQFAEAGEVIQFSDFAKKLSVQEEEVEEWIILAIQYNQIEAQIDQYNQTIVIISNNSKYFALNDWKDLNNQIGNTIENLSKLLQEL